MAEKIIKLKSISTRGLKSSAKGSQYKREAMISYGILIAGYVLLQLGASAGLIGASLA